jgi:uncharacterized SAM-binding protein YcdF (DUF218 family)
MLLENEATNTKENIVNSIPLLEKLYKPLNEIASIIFVCKTFHTRRVFMTARNLLPSHIEFGFQPMIDERDIRRDNWWTSPERQVRVMEELVRVGQYTLKGDLTIR